MKRFVDIRSADIDDDVFAFYCTVVDRFETHGDTQTWVCVDEFVDCFEEGDLERYLSLIPEWVPKS